MPRKPIKFSLDFMKKDIFEKFTLKQFDDVTLTITPLLNNEPYDTSNMTGVIYVGVNNEMYMQDTNITVSSNSIVVTLDKNMLSKDGRAYAEIELTDSNGTVTSSSFIFKIDRKIGEGATIPGSIEGFVEKYKKLTEEFKQQFQNYTTDLDNRFNILTSSQQQDSEVIDARKGEISLRTKIDKIDEQFNTKIQYVTYAQFGAKGDGTYDDGIAIKLAHDYANTHNLPVINTKGEYYIKNTFNIEVKTSVDWGDTVFHVKESEKMGNVVFKILSKNNEFDLTSEELGQLNGKFKKGISFISELANYDNHFLSIYDENTNWTVRSDKTPIKLKDFLMVGQGGYLVGGCARDILNPTKITAIKLDNNYLVVKGGVFNIDLDYTETGYINGIIRCNRSRTIFENNSFIKNTETGTIASNGFIQIENCCDVTVKSPQIPSRVDVPASGGTYGFMLSNCVLIRLYDFKNFSYSNAYWGVAGCNFVKNLYVRDSYLSRLDCHCGLYNLYVDNSNITYYGITVTGGGDLKVNNTDFTKNVIVLRDDYGSRWDGLIELNNITYKIIDNSIPKIIVNDNTISNHDFIYDTMMCTSLNINNFTFDYTSYIDNSHDVNLLLFQKKNFNYKLPYDATFSNIKVKGRESNIKLIYIDKPNEQSTFSNFDYLPNLDGVPTKDSFIEHFVGNSNIKFFNISTKKIVNQNIYGDSHIKFNNCTGDNLYVTNGFAPKIVAEYCDYLNIVLNGAICDLYVLNSTVNVLNCYSGGGRSRATLTNCKLQGNVANDSDIALRLSSDNIALNGCVILPKFLNNVLTKNLTSYDFLSGLSLKCNSHASYLSKSFKDIENYQNINHILNGNSNVTVYPSSATDLGTLKNEYNNLIASLKSIGILKN